MDDQNLNKFPAWIRLFFSLFLIKDFNVQRIFYMVSKYKLSIVIAFIGLLLTSASNASLAVLLGQVTDAGFYNKADSVIYWAPLSLIGITVIQGIGQFTSGYFFQRASQNCLVDLRETLFSRIIHWSSPKFKEENFGKISSRFINESVAAMEGIAQFLGTMVRDVLSVVFLLFLLIYHNWQLTLILVLIAPVIFFVVKKIQVVIKKVSKENQKLFAQLMFDLEQSYRGNRLVKIYNGYSQSKSRFGTTNRAIMRLNMKDAVVRALGTPTTQTVSITGVAMIVAVALVQAEHGTLSLSEFITYISALLLLIPAVQKLAQLNGAMGRVQAAADSLFELIDHPSEDDKVGNTLPAVKGHISLKDVGLHYEGEEEYMVKGLNLEIQAGKTIALVGASGAGKSTVLNLIARFINPTSGTVTIDGISHTDVSLTSLRDQIALVEQDVFLFAGSIKDNICYGAKGEVTDEKLAEVVKAANLSDFIASLPDGLNTPVGELGGKMSGGQKQRIAIARALLKDAPILLLDEATSALDSESEKNIQEALGRLRNQRTTLVVAHRLSTIKDADLIVVMDKGRICEIGSHDDLMAKDGIYKNLYSLQFGE